MTPGVGTVPGTSASWHQALLAHGEDDYVAGIGAYVAQELAAGRPVMVAVPAPSRELLAPALPPEVPLVPMEVLGRNPARVIPSVQDFLDGHAGTPVSVVGETVWPGRDEAEAAEAVRSDALLNAAFAGEDLHVLCAFQADRLDARAVGHVGRTHPSLLEDGHGAESPTYDGLGSWAALPHLADRPDDALEVDVEPGMLPDLRALLRRTARDAALARPREEDLVVAVTELATNSLVHGGGWGALALWVEPDAVVCEVRDHGRMHDPLAGRIRPDVRALGGRGLWMVNQLCDLVHLVPSEAGTTIRVRVCR